MVKYTYHCTAENSISVKDYQTLANFYIVDDNPSIVPEKIRPYDSFAFPMQIDITSDDFSEVVAKLEEFADYISSLGYEAHICGKGEDVYKTISWERYEGKNCWLGKFGILGLSLVNINLAEQAFQNA